MFEFPNLQLSFWSKLILSLRLSILRSTDKKAQKKKKEKTKSSTNQSCPCESQWIRAGSVSACWVLLQSTHSAVMVAEWPLLVWCPAPSTLPSTPSLTQSSALLCQPSHALVSSDCSAFATVGIMKSSKCELAPEKDSGAAWTGSFCFKLKNDEQYLMCAAALN